MIHKKYWPIEWASTWFLMLAISQTALAEQRDSDPRLQEIATVWSRREAKAALLTATWISERTYTKFWANCHVPLTREEYVTLRFRSSAFSLDGAKLRFDSGEVDSSGDAIQFDATRHEDELGRIHHDTARRVFQDDRLRYDKGRKRVDPRKPLPSDWPRNLRSFTTIFDGQRNIQFLPEERGEYPEGYVFKPTQNLFRESLYFRPFVLAFRSSWLNSSPAKWQLKDKPELISGHQCLVLVDSTSLRREYWLDPERDMIVRRFIEDCDVLGVRMKNRFDIQYSQAPDGTWIPSSWTTVFIDNHGLMEQYAATTVINAWLNKKLDEDVFHVDFPPKTWVYDEAVDSHYLVQSKQKPKAITRAELESGLTYADLSGSSSLFRFGRRIVASISDPKSTRGQLLLFVTCGLAIALLGFFIRQKKKPQTN